MSAEHSFTESIVRPLAERDLPDARRIIRLAFATFLGLQPDDPRMGGDSDSAGTRWKADPDSALAAEHGGKLIGSNFAANWGSFGFFGPLTVDPQYWNRGVAQQLLVPTMDIFRRWGTRHLGLYTFANSPKHIGLYQKVGFWPRDLVAMMAKNVQVHAVPVPQVSRFSEVKNDERPQVLAACREVTDRNFAGLDVTREIEAVAEQKLGDTLLAWCDSQLAGLAVCHTGIGTEAGSGVCYVKFAAVRPAPHAREDFERLISAVEIFARSAGAKKITVGVNLARREAFQAMSVHGFRTELQGVAMETGSADSGYNRPGVYILDDWR